MQSYIEAGITIDANCVGAAWNSDKDFQENAIEMFRLAITGEKNSGMYTHDENSQFAVGVGAISLKVEKGGEDEEWLDWQLDLLKKLNAFLNAAQAGIGVSGIDIDNEKEERLTRDYTLQSLCRVGAKLQSTR